MKHDLTPAAVWREYERGQDYKRSIGLYGQDKKNEDILQRLHTMPARILSKDLFYCSPDGTFGAITRSNHPDVQELFTNPDLDADRFTELALTYMAFFEGYHMRFYPPNM